MSSGVIGPKQAETIIAAGVALQEAGVLDSKVDIAAVVNGMIDPSYAKAANVV